MIQAQIDLLLQYMAARTEELVQGKEEYFVKTGGEVHEEDRCYEQRMQAFCNWFLFGRTFHFSTSFTYHPREVNRQIRREIKRRKKKGAVDAREFCWELERMALQHEHFRNVSIDAIYNFETPFLSKRAREPEAQQRG